MVVVTQITKQTITAAGLDGELFRFRGGVEPSMNGPCPICNGKTRFYIFAEKESGQTRYLCSVCGFGGKLSQIRANIAEVKASGLFLPVPDTKKDPK